jgi:uncharacterized protein (TIGR00290 family)
VTPPTDDGTPRRVWLWWSTGKDSAWALHRLRADPAVVVERLVTTVTPRFGRVAIHGTRLAVLEAQAETVGLPLERVELPWPCSNEAYEAAVAPAIRRAEEEGVHAMAFGDLFLEDVRAYREALLAGSPVAPLFPLWGSDTGALAGEMVAAGLTARITSLDPDRLDPALAGAPWDGDFLASLPEGVDPCGENGEFHTCVAHGPGFREALPLEPGEVVEREGFVYADLVLPGDGSD